MDKYCTGCVYRAYVTGGLYCCDYIGITGHARSLICPPGDGCAVRKLEAPKKGRWWIPNPKGGKRTDIDEAKCMELYKMGLSDKKIAEHFGCSKTPIVNWRKRNRLGPSHAPRNRTGSRAAKMANLNGR